MEWLVNFVFALESSPSIRRQLRWAANPGVLVHAGRVVLNDRRDSHGAGTAASIKATAVVRRALEISRSHVAYSELADELMRGFGNGTRERVDNLITQLAVLGFLRSDLFPPLTTEEPARYVLGRLAEIPAARAAYVQFRGYLQTVAACDKTTPVAAVQAHRAAYTHASMLGRSGDVAPIQVDMALGVAGTTVTTAIAERSAQAAELLLRMTPLPLGLPSLARYRQQFLARYGSEREVRLVELVHPDLGIGPLGARGDGVPMLEPGRMMRRGQLLQRLAWEAMQDRRKVVELDEAQIKELETHATNDRLPTSLDLTVSVVARSRAELDRGNFDLLICPNLGAAQAGRHLGRFADLLGAKAYDLLSEAAAAESERTPDEEWAELVYLPRRFRSANVTVRPAVRRFEVSTGVTPSVPPERAIPLNELLVGIRDGRFYVRWPPIGELRVSSSHMLNPLQATAECRFLSEVGRDGLAQFSSFDWGPAAGYPFLPRVQTNGIILRPAQWRIDASTGTSLPTDTVDKFRDGLNRWRERWQVPRHVYLSQGDNRLLLDLDDVAQAEELRRELRPSNTRVCFLDEPLPGPEQTWLRGLGGEYMHELVVSLVANGPPRQRTDRSAAALSKQERIVRSETRSRPPGSDWLFLHLYGPQSHEEELLTKFVWPTAQDALESGLADDWFYIRYSDPDPHLRVRFHGVPERLVSDLLPELCRRCSGLMAAGQCDRFSFNTYDREVERYGGEQGCTESERIFGADSRWTVRVLELLQKGLSRVDGIVLGVVTVDLLLDALGLDPQTRLDWLKTAGTARKEVGPEYRRRRESLVNALGNPSSIADSFCDIVKVHREAIASAATRLRELELSDSLWTPTPVLCRSFVHMHCNRLLRADPHTEGRVLGLLQRARETMLHLPSKEPVEAPA
jgi:thiopeptide-type bacteriocin biosynthesis protein